MQNINLPSVPNECAIFSRVVEGGAQALTQPLAEHVLDLQFAAQDQSRVDALVERAQQGFLTQEERLELDSYLHVESLLAVWKSKARSVINSAHSA